MKLVAICTVEQFNHKAGGTTMFHLVTVFNSSTAAEISDLFCLIDT